MDSTKHINSILNENQKKPPRLVITQGNQKIRHTHAQPQKKTLQGTPANPSKEQYCTLQIGDKIISAPNLPESSKVQNPPKPVKRNSLISMKRVPDTTGNDPGKTLKRSQTNPDLFFCKRNPELGRNSNAQKITELQDSLNPRYMNSATSSEFERLPSPSSEKSQVPQKTRDSLKQNDIRILNKMIGHANKKNTIQRSQQPPLNLSGQSNYPQMHNSISRRLNERQETGQMGFHPSAHSFGLLRGQSDFSKKDYSLFFNKPLSRIDQSVNPLVNYLDSSFRAQEHSFMNSKVLSDSKEDIFTSNHSYRPGGSIFSIKPDSRRQNPFLTQILGSNGLNGIVDPNPPIMCQCFFM